MTNDTLFPKQRDTLPTEWHDCFDELTGRGYAPSSILATIEYVTTHRTQAAVGDEYDVSALTIRNLQTPVILLGPLDPPTEYGPPEMATMDYCNQIAETLGWTEGTEYGVSTQNPSATPLPYLRKPGWAALCTFVRFYDGSDPDV
jgi:hypothetical protein